MRRLAILLIAVSTLLTGCIVYDAPHRDGHHGDRDRDGIPNRVDRDRDNDGDSDDMPEHSGRHGRRILIKGGAVMSMDPAVGNFEQGDVLIEGKRILAVGRNLHAGGENRVQAVETPRCTPVAG